MTDPRSSLTHAIASALSDERRRDNDRRALDRRQRRGSPPDGERRRGDRRRIQRRESAAGHLRNALQVLMPLLEGGTLDDESYELVSGAARRVIMALREVERRRAFRRA